VNCLLIYIPSPRYYIYTLSLHDALPISLTASFPFGTLRKTEEIQLLYRGTSVIKSELIQKIASANPHLYHRDVERIVNVVFEEIDRKSTRLNSSHVKISYADFCLK